MRRLHSLKSNNTLARQQQRRGTTVNSRLADTLLLRTPRYYGQQQNPRRELQTLRPRNVKLNLSNVLFISFAAVYKSSQNNNVK